MEPLAAERCTDPGRRTARRGARQGRRPGDRMGRAQHLAVDRRRRPHSGRRFAAHWFRHCKDCPLRREFEQHRSCPSGPLSPGRDALRIDTCCGRAVRGIGEWYRRPARGHVHRRGEHDRRQHRDWTKVQGKAEQQPSRVRAPASQRKARTYGVTGGNRAGVAPGRWTIAEPGKSRIPIQAHRREAERLLFAHP